MTLSLTCRHCAVEIVGENEDELVESVQEHMADAHPETTGKTHTVTRDKVLGRLRHAARRHGHQHGADGAGDEPIPQSGPPLNL